MSTPSSPPAVVGLPSCFNLIVSNLMNCCFTPFLGAGASSLRPAKLDLSSPPWSQVAARIKALDTQLGHDDARRYLREFARQRVRIAPDEEISFLSEIDSDAHAEESGVDSEPEVESLLEFQAQIVELAAALTHAFGETFSTRCQAVQDVAHCGVPFSLTSSSQALEALGRVLEICKEWEAAGGGWPGTRSDSPFSALPDRIYSKLLVLAYQMSSPEDRSGEGPVAQILAQHNVAELVSDELLTDSGGAELRFDLLEWLSDLLWLTLRVDLPHYPTSAELAFEISLLVRSAPPRRPDLAQAAEAIRREQGSNARDGSAKYLLEQLESFVEYWEKKHREAEQSAVTGSAQPTAFHTNLALAMVFQYQLYSKAVRERQNRPPAPIVFTTNFDQLLEKIFEKHATDYHVIFPVVDNEGRGTWTLYTYYHDRDYGQRGKFSPYTPVDEAFEAGAPSLAGPVLVKLHGAPKIRPPDDAHHALVLSESEYLRAMLWKNRMPTWVQDQLRNRRRHLWFLGYSISDWNIRLRLIEDVLDAEQGGEDPDSLGRGSNDQITTKNLVYRGEDVYRRAIFEELGVRTHTWDLNQLPAMIARALKELGQKYQIDVKGLMHGAGKW